MTGFPINPPNTAIANAQGMVTSEWYRYFAQIQAVVGSAASATWQDGFVLVPAPLAGIAAGDVEGGGAAIPVGVVTAAADYIVRPTDCLVRVDATSAPVSVLLPAAISCPGRVVRVKKIDGSANAVGIADASGATLDGGASLTISAAFDCYALLSTGMGWDAI